MAEWINIKTHGLTGHKTEISTASGTRLDGATRSAVITLDPKKVNTAVLELYCESVEVDAMAEFRVKDPVLGGDAKRVKRIEFADGTIFDPDTLK
jgi:hypothetical protein